MTFAFVLLILVLAAGLGGFYAVWRNPPAIRVEIVLPSKSVDAPATSPPMPQEILDYIDNESEEHARIIRRNRARALFAELGDWKSVFNTLQREDNIENV